MYGFQGHQNTMDSTGLANELYVEVVRGNFLCDQDYKPLPELYYNEYKYIFVNIRYFYIFHFSRSSLKDQKQILNFDYQIKH